VKKGLPFRDAHHVSGAIVADCIHKGKALTDLSVSDFRGFHGLFEKDISEIMDYRHSVEAKKSAGSTHPAEVKKQIAAVRKALSKEGSGRNA
jgi:argininosuccinate lyase